MNVNTARRWFNDRISVFNDPNFVFEEEAHKYTYNGKVLTSATTYVDKFHEHFDTESASASYAAKHGLNQEDVKADWQYKGDVGRYNGKIIHKWIEDFFTEGIDPVFPSEKPIVERIRSFQGFYEEILDGMLAPVAQELRVFHAGKLLSGTIDAVYWVSHPSDVLRRLGIMQTNDLFEEAAGEFQIWDWKTNKVGNFTTDDDYAWKNLKYPFNKLKDNALNRYSIQVSFYRIILEDVAGITTGDSFLCHIPPIEGSIRVHRAKDLRNELRRYMANNFSIGANSAESLF